MIMLLSCSISRHGRTRNTELNDHQMHSGAIRGRIRQFHASRFEFPFGYPVSLRSQHSVATINHRPVFPLGAGIVGTMILQAPLRRSLLRISYSWTIA